MPASVWLVYQVTVRGQLSDIGAITPVLAAVAILPWAPSLALGTAVAWALRAIYYLNLSHALPVDPHLVVEGVELLAGVPLAVIAVVSSRRLARRADLGQA